LLTLGAEPETVLLRTEPVIPPGSALPGIHNNITSIQIKIKIKIKLRIKMKIIIIMIIIIFFLFLRGGEEQGSCASGFGRCCVFTNSELRFVIIYLLL